MFGSCSKLLKLFTKNERKQFYWLLLPMVFSGIVDIMGIAFVVPFMAVVVNPATIQQSTKLGWLYQQLNFTSSNRFLIFLGIVALLILVLGNALSAFVAWLSLHFANMRRYHFSQRLLAKYFYQPYVFFLNRHGADLGKNILNEVNLVINTALMPIMQNIAKSVAVFFILLLLLFSNPGLAVSVALVLGAAFTGVFVFFRKKLSQINQEQYADYQSLSRVVHEGFGGIKEIKLLGKEESFLKQFSHPAQRFAKNYTSSLIIGQLPRYALETIAFGGVLMMIVYLLFMKQTSSQIIPVLSLFAFACYRLMPALQAIFSNISLIRSHQASLDTLFKDLSDTTTSTHLKSLNEWLPFADELKLKQVSFAYPGIRDSIINKIDLTIKAKTTVGFVGSTGAGKTTLIDMVLGLLKPLEGTITVDGVAITEKNAAAWQKNLGYVPQHIFLSDETVAKNIAFGVPDAEIDFAAVERAARIANLHDFIEKELPEGYHSFVGERGVRLSGGQRQRIGIARALYYDPEVLVLDEATSALDGLTETAIMDAIHALAHKKTIIIIAHRLSTVEACDVIYLLEKGAIIAEGSYSELMNKNHKFQQLAKVANLNEKQVTEKNRVQ